MAKKETDIIEQLADTICNYIVYNGSKAGKETAPNDKTFSATILGVNRKFADIVTEDDITNELSKFNIPDMIDEGENSYYTFKINGVYYCKQQYGSFQLYDEIKVYIPNGDWSRMYFDYADGSSHIESKISAGGSNNNIPELWVDTEAPGGDEDLKVGDLWVVVNNSDITEFNSITTNSFSKIYKYYAVEDGGVTKWSTFNCPVGVSYPGSIKNVKVGDMYIKTYKDDPTKFEKIYICTLKSGDATARWAEVYPESEIEYIPNVIITTKKPMNLRDYWIDITADEFPDAKGFYEYTLDSSDNKQKWMLICHFASENHVLFNQYEEPDPDDVIIKLGDYWIKIAAGSTNAVALYQYQYNKESDENRWVLLNTIQSGGSSGVGEWLDPYHTAERFNDYSGNSSNMKYTHIEGFGNSADAQVGSDFQFSSYSHLEGYGNTLTCNSNVFAVHVEGCFNTGTDCGGGTLISGRSNTVTRGEGNFVSGQENVIASNSPGNSFNIISGAENSVAKALRCIAAGCGNTVGEDSFSSSGVNSSIIFGDYNTVKQASVSCVGGEHNTINSSLHSIVNGQRNAASGEINSSLVVGRNHSLTDLQSAGIFGVGHSGTFSNAVVTGWYAQGGSGAVIVGNGSENDPRNTFCVTNSGDVYAAGGYNTIGADYAEYFEWADGNPDNDDRCGMLVMLSGDKIVPAQSDDILGAVSARASVIGNACEEHWHGKYVTDVYGRSTGELSPDYDPKREYIPRSKRPEWSVVGLVGRLVVRDDGSCKVGGYVFANTGIATGTDKRTNCRVLKRIDETHIEVLIK